MYKAFLIKYGEIGVKGKNRFIFEDALVRQIKFSLKDVEGEFDVRRADGRIYVNALSDYDYDEVIESLTRVFGIVGICPVVQIEDNGFDDLANQVINYLDKAYKNKNLTFKVNARRTRKNYPMNSMEINMDQYRQMTERMAPNWMMTVKALTNLSWISTPSKFSTIIMWPVLDTGKNSVSPSTIEIMIV